MISSTMRSWVPRDEESLQHNATTALMHDYTQMQLKTAERLVPWFLHEMPESYFRTVSEADRLQHLRAISALQCHEGEDELRVVTTSESERVVTIVRTGSKPGVLLRQVQQLGRESGRLSEVKVFTSHDGSLCLNVFVFDTTKLENRIVSSLNESAARVAELWGPHESYAAKLVAELGPDNPRSVEFFAPTNARQYLGKCTPSYLTKVRPQRLWQQRELFERVRKSELVKAQLVRANADFDDIDESSWWIQLAAPSTRSRGFLRRILKVISAAGLSVKRCHLDVIDGIGMFRVLVATPDGVAGWDDYVSDRPVHTADDCDVYNWGACGGKKWRQTLHMLERLKWLDDETMEAALSAHGAPTTLELALAETRTALCALTHSRLAGSDNIAYSRAAIIDTVSQSRYASIANDAADYVLRLTAPELYAKNDDENEYDAQTVSLLLKERIKGATAGVDNAAKRVLDTLVKVACAVESSNAKHSNSRCSLALSLDPVEFLQAGRSDDESIPHHVPFSIIYVHGRRFGGYHVRFRKIARGGMRLVTPQSREAIGWERSRQFDECFGLAFAQQLKNKDIPEGGSKAVILVDTLSNDGREDDLDALEHDTTTLKHYACRQAVKAFTDGLLDIVLGTEDMIYLGPDEQIIPEDIEWTVTNAARRGHPTPDAFMSSKADVGINHKEFGVTSEGVVVYVDAALKSVGIDPRSTPFTVKLTGGPDGDVAGNCIKFLFRDYGDNARIVGIADGSGCAEDPDGLDRGELLRLAEMSLPVIEFEHSRLGPAGSIHDASTDAGAALRDSMHARVRADVFVPAGGRPGTLNAQNTDAYFSEKQKPSSSLIVEGANLFLTPEARSRLYRDGGVRVVKDSSANKCGVISSSFEILSAHVLDRQEFEELKPQIVDEIVTKLRTLASLEAKLLFREFHNYPNELPDISTRISQCINDTKDAVLEYFDENSDVQNEVFVDLAPEHLPPTLATYAVERMHRLPPGYIAAAAASFVASRLVYSEGINFCETLPKDRLAQIALDFVQAQRKTRVAVSAVLTAPGLDDINRDAIVRLLDRGGARASLDL